MSTVYKIPQSVLVCLRTQGIDVELFERADTPVFLLSVTGS